MKLARWAHGHQGRGRRESFTREREAEALARALLRLHDLAGRAKPTARQLAQLVTNLMS